VITPFKENKSSDRDNILMFDKGVGSKRTSSAVTVLGL
jgi:hypothetical protein